MCSDPDSNVPKEIRAFMRCKICGMVMEDWEVDLHGLMDHGEPLDYDNFEDTPKPESDE